METMPMINERDLGMFDWYRDSYNGAANNTQMVSSKELLSKFWQPAKSQYLYKLLGNQFIISKPVTYNRATRDIERDATEMLRNHSKFVTAYNDILYYLATNHLISDSMYLAMTHMISCTNLATNLTISNFELNLPNMSKPLNITSGAKVMKMLGKIVEAIKDYTKFCRHEHLRTLDLSAAFEEFRLAHSLVLNQKTLKGKLCLSIHPLDYATASDNECGWSSCMSWQEEGCYRLGTVEMMNSPMVVSVYLASDKAYMDMGGEEWNSKKWRAWAIVTKDIILMNRNFPYENDELNHIALRWIKELAETNLSWQYEYSDKCFDEFNIIFETNYMYNDVCSDMPYVIRPNYNSRVDEYINFSGKAQCMCCGDEIYFDEDNRDDYAADLCCEECTGKERIRCCVCGGIVCDDDIYYDDVGNAYCCDCYNDKYTQCWDCTSDVLREDAYTICIETAEDYRNELGTAITYRFGREWGRLNVWSRSGETCEYCITQGVKNMESYTKQKLDTWVDAFVRREDYDDHYLFLNPDIWTEDTARNFIFSTYLPYWHYSSKEEAEKELRANFHTLWTDWCDFFTTNKDKFVEV